MAAAVREHTDRTAAAFDAMLAEIGQQGDQNRHAVLAPLGEFRGRGAGPSGAST